MKTVVIHGQTHQGSSYHVGRLLVERLAQPGEISEFFLPRDLNHFCLGCYKCLEADENCPFYDEKKVIMDAVKEAELLVFTTPTYCMRASAAMKAFIDLTFTNWLPHRPQACMFSKKAVIVATAAGAGMKSAVKDVKTCLQYWGVPYIKTLTFAVAATGWDEVAAPTKQRIEKKTAKLAARVQKQQVRVGLKTRFLFNLMRLNNKDPQKANTPLAADYRHWKNNGWLDGKRPY